MMMLLSILAIAIGVCDVDFNDAALQGQQTSPVNININEAHEFTASNNIMEQNRPLLKVLSFDQPHEFRVPQKKINDGKDLEFWLSSTAHSDIMTFLLQLNAAMFPNVEIEKSTANSSQPVDTITNLRALVSKLRDIIQEAPPNPGPRRFGNVSFRKWYEIIDSKLPGLFEIHLPPMITRMEVSRASNITVLDELKSYLMGSFGSNQRLDFGTGHELSFLAFLGSIWKLGGFASVAAVNVERRIVLEIVDPYLDLIRDLIRVYNLEPAGSHGVWGLDDHFFLPYIFGSAQLGPTTTFSSSDFTIPQEGSASGAPEPKQIINKNVVQALRNQNLYFGAIGFIDDVKTGPFWEHSPMLYDISGVTAGWAKINKGMLKMYHAEVLSKFPVVQHFPFGSLFAWEQDPTAKAAVPSLHVQNQPISADKQVTGLIAGSNILPPATFPSSTRRPDPTAIAGTKAPWMTSKTAAAPTYSPGPMQSQRAPFRAPGIRALHPTVQTHASAQTLETPNPQSASKTPQETLPGLKDEKAVI